MLNKKTTLIITITILILLFLTSCGAGEGNGDPLEGTSWDLLYYRKSSLIDGTSITATFEEGVMRGSAGCNSYNAEYEVDGNRFSIEVVASTLMACMEPEGAMDQEQFFLGFLTEADSFEITDERLIISRPDGETLTFVPAP